MVRSEEVREGARVRVREDHPKPGLRGLVGVVAKTYSAHDRRALHVRFEDGVWQLMWPRDVERQEED